MMDARSASGLVSFLDQIDGMRYQSVRDLQRVLESPDMVAVPGVYADLLDALVHLERAAIALKVAKMKLRRISE